MQSILKICTDCIREVPLVDFCLQGMQPGAAIKISPSRVCAPMDPLDSVQRTHCANKNIVAYGASTKATTLLYHFKLEERLKFIIDDNPLKDRMFSPGAHIPVYASPALYTKNPTSP